MIFIIVDHNFFTIHFYKKQAHFRRPHKRNTFENVLCMKNFGGKSKGKDPLYHYTMKFDKQLSMQDFVAKEDFSSNTFLQRILSFKSILRRSKESRIVGIKLSYIR